MSFQTSSMEYLLVLLRAGAIGMGDDTTENGEGAARVAEDAIEIGAEIDMLLLLLVIAFLLLALLSV